MVALNSRRSSAFLIVSDVVPMRRTPFAFRNPASSSSMARFSPACPPSVGSTLSGFSFRDELLYHLNSQRLDIDTVRDVFIRHDGRRVGVQQNNLKPLLLQRTARLCPRVVKLAACPMTIGPEPMTSTFFILKSLGIISLLHHLNESVKQVPRILRSRACLRMELHGGKCSCPHMQVPHWSHRLRS